MAEVVYIVAGWKIEVKSKNSLADLLSNRVGSKSITWLEITLVLFCLVFKLIMHLSDSYSTSGGQGCLINSTPPALAMCLAQNRYFRNVCSGNKCLRL